MSEGWENTEPAPIEFLHGRLIDLFHEWRKLQTDSIRISIDGNELNNIIARAKGETYKKYEKLNLRKTIPKNEL